MNKFLKNKTVLFKMGAVNLLITFFLYGCHDTKNIDNQTQNPEVIRTSSPYFGDVKLKIDTISFTVDNLSDGYTTSLQYINDGKPALSLYNKVAHSIDLYDFENGEMYDRIELKKDGPNGVGTTPVGISFLSPDSIVVTNKFDLFLINRQAQIIKKFRLNMDELGGYPDIILKTTQPIIRNGNKLVASVYPQKDVYKYSDLRNWRNFVEFDLLTGKMRSFGTLPEQMQERVLGFNYVDKSFLFNGKEMIISFFPCKDLYRIPYPINETLEKILIDDRNFVDVPEMENKRSKDFMTYTKHYLMNNSFDGIYYNGTHYLRINQKGISEEELNRRDWSKWKVLQIFDKEFNLLLEKDLKSKYGNYMMTTPFEDSFLMAIGRKSEDEMTFVKISIQQ